MDYGVAYAVGTTLCLLSFLVSLSVQQASNQKQGEYYVATIPLSVWTPNKTYTGIRSLMSCAALSRSKDQCQFLFDPDERTCEIGSSAIYQNVSGPVIDIYYRVDGQWGSWSNWSSCSATCNGNKTRYRTCQGNCPTPYSSVGCQGTGVDVTNCSTAADWQILLSCHGLKLMVVGGRDASNNLVNTSEIIDLSGGITCTLPGNYPWVSDGAVGTYISNSILVCGGYYNGIHTPLCNNYNLATHSWIASSATMTVGRYCPAALMLSPTQWWVTGGYDFGAPYYAVAPTTEIYTAGSGFTLSPITLSLFLHNLIRLNSTHVMMIGGNTAIGNPTQQSTPWIMELATGQTYSIAPVIYPTTWTGGLVTYADGTQDVVVLSVGGAQIYSLQTQTWRVGPDISVQWGNSVPYLNSFMVVGGYDTLSINQNTIYWFDPDSRGWAILGVRLAVPRYTAAAFLVPDMYCY